MILIPEILQLQAMIPVIRASMMDTMAMKNVDLNPVKNRGRYSSMTLKLKSTSMGHPFCLYGCTPTEGVHHYFEIITP